MASNKTGNVQVTFSNYNNAFSYFFNQYKELCLSVIAERNIKLVNNKTLAFLCDFEYAIPETNNKSYRSKAMDLFNKINTDLDLEEKQRRANSGSFLSEVEYTKIYYKYFIEHLNLIGSFAEELTPSFMPNTTIQQKLVRFANDQPFYDTLTQFKQEVVSNLGAFDILDFKKPFNSLLTFYYAYSLFINEKVRHIVDKTLTLILSLYLNEKILNIIKKKPHFTMDDRKILNEASSTIFYYLMFCNLHINKSFSNYGILPKIEKKQYDDRTLI